ncbi:TIGR03826 family flagellar region protein [Alkalihalobacillus sp. BA299]|uniref:TIGR03826 family flagellar region protein n=1 Tax=Alkalihalobacillus sp. BA299 TaxID=2815938 RepID=UPI001ADA2C6B|nr:TIGR03826 family flagellar region protein [Alkalihalobacillus sp. BA299]
MPNLENCPRCGGLFIKALRSICDKCHKEVDQMFQTVYTFIRKRDNRKASLQEVVEATGVKEEYIFQFIREGRLQLAEFPNLGYPCDSCGKLIREGKLCTSCFSNLKKDLEQHHKEQEIAERHQKKEHSTRMTYHLFNDDLRKK